MIADTRDFAEIAGQEKAVRALAIAAVCSRCNVLMIGSRISDARRLAECFPSIMPPLVYRQRKEAASIWAECDLDASKIVEGAPPMRAPHHSAPLRALVGSGQRHATCFSREEGQYGM